jgi:mxaJ protein
MCFLCRAEIRRLFALLAFALLCPQAKASAPAFKICAEPDNLPMSQRSSQTGFEIDVAKILAQELGQELEVKWVAQRDHSYFRQTIGAGVCDAIIGVPSSFGRLETTDPWYRAGFVFVGRGEPAPSSFDDPRLKKMIIGVPATGLGETPPVMALTRRRLEKNLRPYSIYEPQKMIAAVADKKIDVAVMWGPFGEWFASQENKTLTIQQTQDRDGPIPLAFEISVGVRKGNEVLKQKLNQALKRRHHAIAAVLTKWHISTRGP